MAYEIDLSGRVAFVTGASSGLGAQFARTLSRAGAAVVLAARRTDRLATLRAEIEATGGDAHVVALDVTDIDSIRAAVACFMKAQTSASKPGSAWTGQLAMSSYIFIVPVHMAGVATSVNGLSSANQRWTNAAAASPAGSMGMAALISSPSAFHCAA